MIFQKQFFISSHGKKKIWIIYSSQTVKYYREINIYKLVVKNMASMAITPVLQCNELNLAKVSYDF